MFPFKMMWISFILIFVIESNCAVVPTISPTDAPANVQKKSNIVYEFKPSDSTLQSEELNKSINSPIAALSSEIKDDKNEQNQSPKENGLELIAPALEPIPQNLQSPVRAYNNPFGGPYAPSQGNNFPARYYVPQSWVQLLDSISQTNPPAQMSPPAQMNAPIGYPIYPPFTEYEGILVPVQNSPPFRTQPQQQNISQRTPNPVRSSRVSTDLLVLLKNLFPPNVIYLIVHWGTFIMNAFSVIAFGGLLTSAICSLTPICTISFGALPLSAAFKRNLGIDNDAINNNQTDTSTTLARVRRASNLFQSALEKYEQLQKVIGNERYQN